MHPPLTLMILAGAIALAAAPFVLRILIARVMGRPIGSRVAAGTPDEIHLLEAAASAWNRPDEVQKYELPLRTKGFQPVGVWRVKELPGVVVALMVDEPHAILACVYEHPVAGIWCELVVRSNDGSVLCVSSSKPTGLDAMPGHTRLHRRGASAEALLVALAQRSESSPRIPIHAAQARERFEAAWAEHTAWRRTKGISTAEVVQVAARRIA